MGKVKIPSTPALRFLKSKNIDFSVHPYNYVDKGGTEVAARELDVDEHSMIKTLVMKDSNNRAFIVLQHGDCEVSTKQLARQLDVKSVSPCSPDEAKRHTGYLVGGTSPFGIKKKMPVYCEAEILELEHIYINAGQRGLLVKMQAESLAIMLKPVEVRVAI